MGFFSDLKKLVTSDEFVANVVIPVAKFGVEVLRDEQDKKDNPTGLFDKGKRYINNLSGQEDVKSANRNNMMNLAHSFLNNKQYDIKLRLVQKDINNLAESINQRKTHIKNVQFFEIAKKLNTLSKSTFGAIQVENFYELQKIELLPIASVIPTLLTSYATYIDKPDSRESAKEMLVQSLEDRKSIKSEEDYLKTMLEGQKNINEIYQTADNMLKSLSDILDIQIKNLDVIIGYKNTRNLKSFNNIPLEYKKQLDILSKVKTICKIQCERTIIQQSTIDKLRSYQELLYSDYNEIEKLHNSSGICNLIEPTGNQNLTSANIPLTLPKSQSVK